MSNLNASNNSSNSKNSSDNNNNQSNNTGSRLPGINDKDIIPSSPNLVKENSYKVTVKKK